MPRPVHFDITAEDPDRAVSFYEQAFGWKFNHWGRRRPDGLLADRDRRHAAGHQRRPQPPKRGRRPATTNTIDVASLDDAMEAVKPPAARSSGDRMPIPGVGWFAAFTDTEGNRFGLMQSDDAAG